MQIEIYLPLLEYCIIRADSVGEGGEGGEGRCAEGWIGGGKGVQSGWIGGGN